VIMRFEFFTAENKADRLHFNKQALDLFNIQRQKNETDSN